MAMMVSNGYKLNNATFMAWVAELWLFRAISRTAFPAFPANKLDYHANPQLYP